MNYKASRDSHCGKSAQTGDDFPKATKRADTADGNGTSVPKVEMHQLKKLSKGVAQRCNSMCREAIVESLTLLTSRPTCSTICRTCFSTMYIRS